jgi:hypothetical protein
MGVDGFGFMALILSFFNHILIFETSSSSSQINFFRIKLTMTLKKSTK